MALGQVCAELDAAVDAANPKWSASVARRTAEEVAKAKRLLTELEAGLESLRHLEATGRYLAAAAGDRRYKLALPMTSGLHTANGDQLALALLLGEVTGWLDRANVDAPPVA